MRLNADLPEPIQEAVRKNLAKDDDPRLWTTALGVLVDEFLEKRSAEAKSRGSVLIVGACSHWVRPHQSRWRAAGGFAWPEGYRNANPELDWKIILIFNDGRWESLRKLPGKGVASMTVAIPARTGRHNQAAIHTKWSTSERPVLFGFRKIGSRWECVAASDEAEHGKVMVRPDGAGTGLPHE